MDRALKLLTEMQAQQNKVKNTDKVKINQRYIFFLIENLRNEWSFLLIEVLIKKGVSPNTITKKEEALNDAIKSKRISKKYLGVSTF